MIKKYTEYLNEKLSDKLSGFDEEGLKQQLYNNKIDFKQYLKICKNNNIEYPNKEDIINIFMSKLGNYSLFYIKNLNRDFHLNLDYEDMFKCIGYDQYFNDATDFINYIFTNFKKEINDDSILYYNNNILLMKIYNKLNFINVNINLVYDILEYWMSLDKHQIDELFNTIIKKYYDTDEKYIVGFLTK